jgi:hypothetical protein
MALAVVTGWMQGAYFLSMKYTRVWESENFWLVASLFGI